MIRRRRLAATAALLVLAGGLCGFAPAGGAYVARLQALALLQTLNADLLSHDSATAVLQDWCDAHGPGGLKIKAERVLGQEKPLPAEAKTALGVGAGVRVRYRRVRLACGANVLSEADNWYLPDRLTVQMNQTLDATDTPFGVVVRPLDFRRRNLSAELLYRPLARGWEISSAPDDRPVGPFPAQVLQHRAVLSTAAGTPFSYVVETYTGAVLDMAEPR